MSEYTSHKEAVRETLREHGNKMPRDELAADIAPRFEWAEPQMAPEERADNRIQILLDNISNGIVSEEGMIVNQWVFAEEDDGSDADADDGNDVDSGGGVRCDGGQTLADRVGQKSVERAIRDHDDPDHPDAVTPDDVERVWADIQSHTSASWAEWCELIEYGDPNVVGETDELVLLDSGQHNMLHDELELLDGIDGDEETRLRNILTQIMHDVADGVEERRWPATYPFVLEKPDGAEGGQRYAEAVVNELQQRGLSPGQAWAYYGVEIRGNSMNQWGKRKGDHDHKTVSDALEKAREKLP